VLAHLDGDCTREHLTLRLRQLALRSWPPAVTDAVSDAAAALRRAIVSPQRSTLVQGLRA
jgi:hypothetical protein